MNVEKQIEDAIDALIIAAFTEGGRSEHRVAEARIQTELREKELRALLSSAQSVELAATQPAAQGMDAQDAECLEIGRELYRACDELPWGYEIILYLEQGSGTVHWMDKEGNEHDIGEDGVFSEKIGYAIAAAQAKQGG